MLANAPGWIPQPWLIQIVTVVGGSLAGSFVGYKLGRQSHIFEKRHDFLLDQLKGFYSPMLGLRADITLQTFLRSDPHQPGSVDLEDFTRVIWPLYRNFASHFTANLWLASPDTREFHGALLKLLNSIEYQLDEGMIGDTDDLVGYLYGQLGPFYDHLDTKLDQLQRKLIPDI